MELQTLEKPTDTTGLFSHQIEGISFLTEKKKAILADEMGLGKTRQAIYASAGKVLVVCPASVKSAWEREIRTVSPEASVVVISAGMDPMEYEHVTWRIINYDILDRHAQYFATAFSRDLLMTLILDEAHYIKNATSKRTKAALLLAKFARYVFELTGTPIMNRPAELYTLLKAIGHPIAANWIHFVRRYCGAYRQTFGGKSFWDTSGATHLAELRMRIRDAFLRREKKDVLDLPEKLVSVVEMEMTAEWRTKYVTAFDDYIAFLKENPPDNLDNIILARHLVELQKMKRVCSHAKMERILSDIEEMVQSGEKVIVFTQYNDIWEEIKAGLQKKGIDSTGIRGETKTEDRTTAVSDFQTFEHVKVFVANIDAGGIGITLTAASMVIFADLDWTPAAHQQAEDRAHRIGQAGTVNVYYYILKDTLEEDVLELLGRKSEIVQKILKGEEVGRASRNVASDLIRRISGGGDN